MSLNRDMTCASVFARRNAFGIGHFVACFFWRCVSNFFLIRHTVSFLQKCPKIRFTAFYALKASRGAARPVQTLSESYRAILRPPKWQTTPVLRTAPLRGRNHRGTESPCTPYEPTGSCAASSKRTFPFCGKRIARLARDMRKCAFIVFRSKSCWLFRDFP